MAELLSPKRSWQALRRKAGGIVVPSLLVASLSGGIGPLIDGGHGLGDTILASFFMGLLGSAGIFSFEILIKRPYLHRLPFGGLLLVSAVVDFFIIGASLLAMVLVFNLSDGKTPLLEMIQRTDFLAGLLAMVLVTLLAQSVMFVNTLIGKGVLLRILLGRYHRPVEAERFFLFIDLKSSTAIAEQTGHRVFLELLNDFFHDLGEAVLQTRGEIYKYVGDEAIVVWDRRNGSKDANCLECFFVLENLIQSRSAHYRGRFGLVPEFKAGLHFGTVVVGETGSHRKEIAYLGDVVNTCARIESVCGETGQKFLVSGQVLAAFPVPAHRTARAMGESSLRGKKATVSLFSLE